MEFVDCIVPFVSQIDTTLVSVVAAVAASVGAIASAIVAYKVYRQQTSPDVIVYTGTENGRRLMELFIVNIGNSPAWDVSVDIDGEVPLTAGAQESVRRGALGKGIPFLPPGGRRVVPMAASHQFVKDMEGRTVMAKVSYSRTKGGRAIEGSYPLEGESFCGDRIDLVPLQSELAEIAKVLKTIEGKNK